jgi:hypothetical protein
MVRKGDIRGPCMIIRRSVRHMGNEPLRGVNFFGSVEILLDASDALNTTQVELNSSMSAVTKVMISTKSKSNGEESD